LHAAGLRCAQAIAAKNGRAYGCSGGADIRALRVDHRANGIYI